MNKNFLELADHFLEQGRISGDSKTPLACAVEAILMHLQEQQKPTTRFELATQPGDEVPGVHDIVEKLATVKRLQQVVNKLGSWASAAQDDPDCCQELKDIFAEVLELAEPLPPNTDDIDYDPDTVQLSLDDFANNRFRNARDYLDDLHSRVEVGSAGTHTGPSGPDSRDCDPKGCAEPTALDVLRKLNEILPLGDLCYYIREREGQGWEGPKVAAWGIACARMQELFKKDDRLKFQGHQHQPDGLIAAGCFTDRNPFTKPWPKDWPPFYHRNEPCDMLVGPCSCGAWHVEGEFILVDSKDDNELSIVRRNSIGNKT